MVEVSVVIPTYNCGQYIEQAVASVLSQSHRPAEIIIVDDGSTDDTPQRLRRFGIDVQHVVQRNRGAAAARNVGIALAKGDWIAFIDADDVWEPRKIERQLEVAEASGAVCVHSGFYLFGDVERRKQVSRRVLDCEYTIENLLIEPLINTSTAMVRAGLSARFPVWTGRGGDGEDMIFFAELSEEGLFTFIDETLAGYRMHTQQTTKRGEHWLRHLQNRFQWVNQQEQHLSVERAEKLRRRLREQTLEWLQLAKWNRQWERYHMLRVYAASLPWEGELPPVLQARLLPRSVYRVKDFFDGLFGRHRSVEVAR